MPKNKKQVLVNPDELLKAVNKGLQQLERFQKHEQKLAKHRDKAIAALLEIEALVEGGEALSKVGKSKPKSKKGKKQGGSKTPGSTPNSNIASLMESLGSVRAKALDDLEMIAGIGPKLAETLNEMGISTFQQIAEWTEDDIKRIDERLNFPGRILREQWVEQASALVAGGREEYIRVFGKEPR